MKLFFAPLSDILSEAQPSRRWLVVFWSSLVLLVALKITLGDASFFAKFITPAIAAADTELLAWYKWLYHFIATFILFAVIPVVIIRTVFKEPLSGYGICLGDWKFGMVASLAAFVVLSLPLWLSANNAEHLSYYPLTMLAIESPQLFGLWALSYLPHYIGWEIFFRGYIGLGAKKQYGAFSAILLQVLVSTLMHIGKPGGETFGAIVGGIYLGLLTYRTRSILWAIIFHWYLGLMNTYFCGMAKIVNP